MASRATSPGPKLPFLKDRDFEDEAAILLAEYGQQHGVVSAPPVPIDEIVELHLGLRLEFKDMQQLFGVDDVHGALWVNQWRVGIDRRLDPAANPAMLGRYRFTLAHEAGHWLLHRQFFKRAANQLQLLPETRAERDCETRESLEWKWDAKVASV